MYISCDFVLYSAAFCMHVAGNIVALAPCRFNGRFLHGPHRKMLYLYKPYLLVHYWSGKKGRETAPLLEDVFQYETF